jgi:outer membrane autotransporter protein
MGKSNGDCFMKKIFLFLFFVLSIAGWSSSGFAVQTINPDGALDVTGVAEGVDMIDGAGTLTVGIIGGPVMDIFTNNSAPFVGGLVAVATSANSTDNIVFNSGSTVYGDIGIANPGGPYFLNVAAGNDDTIVNFQGFVYTTGMNVLGTGTVNFNSGAGANPNQTPGGAIFDGDGTISLAANTTVNGVGGLTTITGSTGTLELRSGSMWVGAVGSGVETIKSVKVIGGSNTAGVSATINGAVDADTFDLGTNTLNITGALSVANNGAGGIINTTLASPTVYGRIIPTGASTYGATLGINVLVPSTSYIPVGTEFSIVQATSGTDGTTLLTTIQNPTNPLYTFTAVPLTGTTAGLVRIRTATIPMQTSENPTVPILIDIPSTPDIEEVLAPINALTDPDAIDNAVAQLAPSTPTLSAPLVVYRETRQFQDLWLSHLDNVRCNDVAQLNVNDPSCNNNETHSGLWAKGVGYTGTQDARDGFTAYDTETIGGMLAYDLPISTETRVGLGIGYGQTSIDGKTFDAETDFDTYQLTGYIGHDSGPWFVNGDASFGWNEYSSTRHMVFPGFDRTAKADYSGQSYTLFANTGYHFPVVGFTFTPLASLQYSRLHIDNYRETGAGDINLKVNSQSYDFLESGLGMKIARAFITRKGSYVPEVHAKWLHKLSNPDLTQTASYSAAGSASFTTAGLRTADDTFNAGAGLTFLSCKCGSKTWSIEGVYDYDWTNEGYDAHQVMAKVTMRF